MRRAIVVETFNLHDAADPAAALALTLTALAPSLRTDDDLVVTDAGLAPATRAAARAVVPTLRFEAVPKDAGYYAHKNLGAAATHAGVIAFVDGDCVPAPGWLEAITDSIVDGAARVVAGPTRYPDGAAAVAASAIDFPVVHAADGTVRSFFANNVAFERTAFTARGYVVTQGISKGACALLAIRLRAAGIAIQFAPRAGVRHAWPGDLRAMLAMRLRRGADARAMAPSLVRATVPLLRVWSGGPSRTLGVALLVARNIHGAQTLVRSRPSARTLLAGVAFIGAASVVDAIGVLAMSPTNYALPSAAAGAPAASREPKNSAMSSSSN